MLELPSLLLYKTTVGLALEESSCILRPMGRTNFISVMFPFVCFSACLVYNVSLSFSLKYLFAFPLIFFEFSHFLCHFSLTLLFSHILYICANAQQVLYVLLFFMCSGFTIYVTVAALV